MKSGVPYELREVGCPVRLDYDGRKMVLKDAYESAASFLSNKIILIAPVLVSELD